ncbi:helix-turn-helix transcriptional regulator [bacterium]|nr:helix-turn-helix transcriptional regulator [bacterium]
MINEKISKKLKLERIKAGLTQEQLAEKSGLSRNSIQKIETGKVSPTVETLEKLALAFNMDFQTFIDVSKVEI